MSEEEETYSALSLVAAAQLSEALLLLEQVPSAWVHLLSEDVLQAGLELGDLELGRRQLLTAVQNLRLQTPVLLQENTDRNQTQ